MFNEICIYEAKLTKLDEIEELMREVAEFYLEQDGVIDVHYIKRTHRQKDFNAVKEGELPIRLTKNVGKVTYVLYWVLENEEAHARVSIANIKNTNSKQKRRTNGSSPAEKYKREPSGWRHGEGPDCGFSSCEGWLSSWTTFSQSG